MHRSRFSALAFNPLAIILTATEALPAVRIARPRGPGPKRHGPKPNRYRPHQGEAERARRLRQLASGFLQPY